MSAICGIVQLDGAPVDAAALRSMVAAAPHRAPDGVRSRLAANVGFAHLAFHATPESVRELQPLADATGRCMLVADARLDNRDELLAGLRGIEDLAANPTDADLLLASYLRWGDGFVERLLGDFAFAVWDHRERRLLLARDALGGRGLFYHCDGRRCLFASEVGQLLDLPDFFPRPDETRIAQFLGAVSGDEERTFFTSISACPSAHIVTVSTSGVRRRRYWAVDPEARLRCRDEREAAERFLELVTVATRDRLRSRGPVGLSLSGGLDSGLLAAVASRLLRESGGPERRLATFSYTFDELASCDERHFIAPIVERCGLDATFLPADELWTLKDLPRWPVMSDFIWSDAYVLLPTAVARAARDTGCRLLLNGQFGDALFIGGCYWAADLLRDGRWLELLRTLRHPRAEVHWRRDLLDHGLRQLVPSALKRWLRRQRPAARPALGGAIHPDLVARTGVAEPPREDPWQQRYRAPGQQVRLVTLTASFWTQGFAEARAYHHRFGLEVESPYHDRRLVELIMALPAYHLGLPWRERRVQRDALSHLAGLPEIGEREGKADFDPLMYRGLCERELGTVLALLSASRAVERGWVRAEWTRHTAARLERGAALTYEELSDLWLCLCLELWLRTPTLARLG